MGYPGLELKTVMNCLITLVLLFAASASAQITLEIQDYATLPITGKVDGKTNYDALLARVSGLREEPGGANRLFVPDLNGPLYVVDRDTRKATVYLDFNGREGKPGIFHKLFVEAGFGSGLNMLYFDPDYRTNGKFYTVHIEDPAAPGFETNGLSFGIRYRPFSLRVLAPTCSFRSGMIRKILPDRLSSRCGFERMLVLVSPDPPSPDEMYNTRQSPSPGLAAGSKMRSPRR